MTATPTTGPYQAARKATLRGLTHARVLETARALMKANQKNGHRYARKIKYALRDGDGIHGTDGVKA